MNRDLESNKVVNEEDPAGAILDLEDEALANISGGCCPFTSAQCTPCPPVECF